MTIVLYIDIKICYNFKAMNKDLLISSIENLSDVSTLKFVYNGLEVSSRFDNQEKPFEETNYLSLLSYNLYSITINSIILKGLGKIRSKNLLKSFYNFFSKIEKNVSKDIYNDTKKQTEKAKNILEAFLFDYEKISLSQLLANYLPLVVINLSSSHKEDEKKIFKLFDNNKEMIINQATLYVRSAYHSLLTIDYLDQTLLSFDKNDILNGILFYDDIIIFSTYKDACTFNGFKHVLLDDVNYLADYNRLDNAKKIALLYLVRDTIVYFEV